MVLVRRDLRVAPFVEPIDLERITPEVLLQIEPDRVALVEYITPDLFPRLVGLLEEARGLVATSYLGEREDIPHAVLVPNIYVLVDPPDYEMFDAVATTSAIPIDPEEWENEQEALSPLLTDPLDL
jgi:hypothetical protein